MPETRQEAKARRKLQVYVPNPPLDHFLTALFAVEIVFVTFVLYDESQKPDEENNPLATFAVFLGICYAMISIVRVLSVQVAYGVNRLLPYLGLVSKPPIQGRVQMNKWQDQSWQLVVHASMTATEVYILTYDCPGLWSDSFLAWVPSPFINYKPSLLLKRFYIFQLAIWTVTCFIHRFSMERIKDYFMMYFHHILTIGLIVGSYYEKYLRIGLLVLLVHDASDVGVDLLKLFNYMKVRNKKGYHLVEIVFGLNLTSWIYWRLYVFPFHVIYSSLVFSVIALDKPDTEPANYTYEGLRAFFSTKVFYYPGLPNYGYANILLLCLQVLHIIWTFLFLRILARLFMEDPQRAAQVEYEGESDEDHED